MVKKWLGSNVGVGNVGNILDELQSLSPPCFSDSVFEFAFVTGLDRNRTTSDFRNRNRDWNFSVWAEQVKSIRSLQPKALNLTVWNPYYGCGWIVWYKDNSPATFFKKIAGVFWGGECPPRKFTYFAGHRVPQLSILCVPSEAGWSIGSNLDNARTHSNPQNDDDADRFGDGDYLCCQRWWLWWKMVHKVVYRWGLG